MNTKTLLLTLITATTFVSPLVVSPLVVRGDYEGLTPIELTDQSDAVILGRVAAIDAGKSDKPYRATINLKATYKGKIKTPQVVISIEQLFANKCPSGVTFVELLKNTDFIFFLKHDANGANLVNRYDAIWPANAESIAAAKKVIDLDAKLEQQFKQVLVAIVVHNKTIFEREPIPITLTARNDGKEDVQIDGVVVDQQQQLKMSGWMNIHREWIVDGKVIQDDVLGGASFDGMPRLIIPAGKELSWKTDFKWSVNGPVEGTYRLRWRVGKVISDPATYRVLKNPPNT